MNKVDFANESAIWKDPGELYQPNQRLLRGTAAIADAASSPPNHLLHLTHRLESGAARQPEMES